MRPNLPNHPLQRTRYTLQSTGLPPRCAFRQLVTFYVIHKAHEHVARAKA
jgi:hypothetical protein